jgi:predicted AlkP superfamily phosphohydrolase/phosphomutase
MKARKRVLIIGLDGFTWNLGRGFMAEGVMPQLAGLVEQGCAGNLRSVMPFETSPAWSSFQTGCGPGKTGVFAFHTYDRMGNKVRLNSFGDIAVPSLWELADRTGRKVVSLNVPVSSPPPKVGGVIIPGLLCPKLSAATVHPPQAWRKYIKPHKDYFIVNKDPQPTAVGFTEQAIATERARVRVALELMRDVDWDVFCVQMQSCDSMQHSLWWALDPEAKGHEPEARREALTFYKFCDGGIGKLMAAAGEGVLTLVVSDHGFCALDYAVSINVWLRQKGYLQLLPQKERVWSVAKKKIKPLKSMAKTYGDIRKGLEGPGRTPPYYQKDLVHIRRIIDLEKTKAFCLGGMGGILYINGTLPERAELAKKLTSELLRDLGPASAKPVIAQIRPGSQVYGESARDSAPDLVAEFGKGVVQVIYPLGDAVVEPARYDGKQHGTHERNGIIAIHGPGIKSGEKLDGDIIDIVPTVLAYFGISVPRHIDGKVLSGAFIEPPDVDFEDMDFGGSAPADYSDAEQAEVERHLADLGYM